MVAVLVMDQSECMRGEYILNLDEMRIVEKEESLLWSG